MQHESARGCSMPSWIGDSAMMMMSFICSCRANTQIQVIGETGAQYHTQPDTSD
jgi:hypothetical protein